MRKAQLVKILKQLDGACEAIERLENDDEGLRILDKHNIDFSAIVILKNDVENAIDAKTRKK